MEGEEKRFVLYMAASAYHVISKEVENRIFTQKMGGGI